MDYFQHCCYQPIGLLLYGASEGDPIKGGGNPSLYVILRCVLEK